MFILSTMWPKSLADEMQPITSKPRVHQLALYYQLRLLSFFLLTSFYRVRDSAPDGSSPRGYSQIFFGYRLKDYRHTYLIYCVF
jgi:hypothetical protein